VVRLGKAIEEKETISYEHQTTISELKRKYGKQLDKTLTKYTLDMCNTNSLLLISGDIH
jgi:hypothetical protein